MNCKKELHVAYFSMEIAIEEDIPTYSGGLGVLAGDHLRSCCDLEVPVIGLTLFYKKGYFKQKLDHEGNQQEVDEDWNYEKRLEKLPNTVQLKIEDRDITVGAWKYTMKSKSGAEVPIILLDTDIEGNSDFDRTITQKLYANDRYYRLAQEIVLGVGGCRMLRDLGYNSIHKYHMNEGHSALLTLELINTADGEKTQIDDIKEQCVFTTHTPVPAGHDAFDREMAERMLGELIPKHLVDKIFHDNHLNMTYLGLNFSEYVNGVAKKHGEVSRDMFPGYRIESITNGVHTEFWTCPSMKRMFDKYIPGCDLDPFSLRYVLSIPNDDVWKAHIEAKAKLVNHLNEMYNANMDPQVFTIGFARRAATYKRGDLLFKDIERLKRIADKFEKGIQIVYGGKAHPSDKMGKDIIKNIHDKVKELDGYDKVKFCYVENYEMKVAKLMVSGVDVWLNTPMRPKEASGTSGMKAALNGVPHFSVLDGWWLEGHVENLTGWCIGKHPDVAAENDNEEDAEDLYTKLEYLILPKFYGDKSQWVEMMRHCIAINGSFFNTHRMVQQYVVKAYFT